MFVGIEDEENIHSARTLKGAELALQILADFAQRQAAGFSGPVELVPEMHPDMLEARSAGAVAPADIPAVSRMMRFQSLMAARRVGALVVATGMPLDPVRDPTLSGDERIEQMVIKQGMALSSQRATGSHLHIASKDIALRLQILNRMIDYLPALFAFSANSLFYDGHFTGAHSYRYSHWSKDWTVAVPDVAQNVVEAEKQIRDAAIDAELSGDNPHDVHVWLRLFTGHDFVIDKGSMELRTADTLATPDDVLVHAALVLAAYWQARDDVLNEARWTSPNVRRIEREMDKVARHGRRAEVVDPTARRNGHREVRRVDDIWWRMLDSKSGRRAMASFGIDEQVRMRLRAITGPVGEPEKGFGTGSERSWKTFLRIHQHLEPLGYPVTSFRDVKLGTRLSRSVLTRMVCTAAAESAFGDLSMDRQSPASADLAASLFGETDYAQSVPSSGQEFWPTKDRFTAEREASMVGPQRDIPESFGHVWDG